LWKKLSEKGSPEEAYRRLQSMGEAWDLLPPEDQNKIIQELVKTVWISKSGITIEFSPNGLDATKIVIIQGTFYTRGSKPQVFIRNEEESVGPTILKNLIQAEVWHEDLVDGKYSTYEEMADAYKLEAQYIRKNISFAFLSPKIKEAIVLDKLPQKLHLHDFNISRPSRDWSEQEAKYLGKYF